MGLEPTTFELEVQHASPLRHGGFTIDELGLKLLNVAYYIINSFEKTKLSFWNSFISPWISLGCVSNGIVLPESIEVLSCSYRHPALSGERRG